MTNPTMTDKELADLIISRAKQFQRVADRVKDQPLDVSGHFKVLLSAVDTMEKHVNVSLKAYYEKSGITAYNRTVRGDRHEDQLWLCGQIRPCTTFRGFPFWELQGIFSTRDKALGACVGPNYFIAPITLDQELPDTTEAMENVEYPMQ